MASAAELLVPLRPGLVAVPAGGQTGVCQFCHGACDPAYGQCAQCLAARRSVGAVDVLAISMSVEGELLHRYLRGYKDDRLAEVRARMSLRLAALVAVFLDHHAACVGAFDSVVAVPSPTRTAADAVVSRVRRLRDERRPALEATGTGNKGELRSDRFRVTRDVAGERLLVLDDTFTSGATLFSAVAALREADAVAVGPLVIGQHVRPEWPPSAELLAWLRRRRWDERRCSRCDGERVESGRLL